MTGQNDIFLEAVGVGGWRGLGNREGRAPWKIFSRETVRFHLANMEGWYNPREGWGSCPNDEA